MPKNADITGGQSYVNKDFNSIYSELLDLTKTLTNRWDPTVSNESDPGVVLIKLGALLADKDNYNIDKNILEAFPGSVSQYGNARRLYDLAGYSMSWYKSAETDVTFSYSGSELSNSTNYVIKLNKLDTMISDDSGEIIYTLLDNGVLTPAEKSQTIPCIQGVVQRYEINGSSVVTLENLDEYNRLYFNEKFIAENGIFISNYVSESTEYNWEWKCVDTLTSYPLNKKVFKFGVTPDSDTCYIEFPQDIVNLIGSGLIIKYVVTLGERGNISAHTLTSLYSSKISATKILNDGTTEDVDVTSDIQLTNGYSVTSGKDIEDISEAYRNYKQTVGTFNTLVTCKDYESALKSMREGRNYIASNCVVSDRTNDINNTTYLMTPKNSGSSRTLLSNNNMDAFKLGLYVLEPMSNIVNSKSYNRSFSVNSKLDAIKSDDYLESYKSIQHEYIDTTPQDPIPYVYKNYYKLTGTVSTYNKVSETEASEIELNIKSALFKKFNARNVNFGVEVEYDDLIDTIRNADSRIKYVVLNQPEYEVRIMYSDDFEGTFSASRNLTEAEQLDIVSKMVADGTIQLFDFDHSFNYEFGQTEVEITNPVYSISTEVKCEVTDANPYVIGENENIVLYTSSWIPDISYTSYVNFKITGLKYDIKSGEQYYLTDGEALVIKYVDTNNVPRELRYVNRVIRPNFDIDKISSSEFHMMGASDTLEILKKNATDFNSGLLCLWFTKNSSSVSPAGDSSSVTYTLFDTPTSKEIAAQKQERILENNEYFIYTNAQKNELVILTSGTRLIRTLSGQEGNIQVTNRLDVSEITANGQSAIDQNDWFVWRDHVCGSLSAEELSIVTLGEGSIVSCDNVPYIFTSSPKKIQGPKYKTNTQDEFTALPTIRNLNEPWYGMSRFNLSMSSENPQYLKDERHIITIKDSATGKPKTFQGSSSSGCYVLSNYPINISGGNNIDVTFTDMSGETSNRLQLYKYTKASDNVSRNIDNWYIINGNNVELNYSFVGNCNYILPIMKVGEKTIQIVAKGSSGNLVDALNTVGSNSNALNTITLDNPSFYYIEITADATHQVVKLVVNTDGEDLYIGKIYKQSKNIYNPILTSTLKNIRNDLTADSIMKRIQSYGGLYDFTYEVDEKNSLDFTVVKGTTQEGNALSPKMFWDVNHICNKFTIPQMNTEGSSITVSASSKL